MTTSTDADLLGFSHVSCEEMDEDPIPEFDGPDDNVGSYTTSGSVETDDWYVEYDVTYSRFDPVFTVTKAEGGGGVVPEEELPEFLAAHPEVRDAIEQDCEDSMASAGDAQVERNQADWAEGRVRG